MVAGGLLPSIGGAIALVVGIGVAIHGYRQRRLATAIESEDPTPIAEIDPGSDGPVLVTGRAEEGPDGTIEAPIAETEGVVVDTTVEYQQRDPGGGSTSHTELDTVEHAAFVLEDDTGRARVDLPDDIDVSLEESYASAWAGDAPSPRIASYVEDLDDIEVDRDKRREFRQGVLEPGESAVVFAEPAPPTDASDHDVVLGPGRGQAVVSDKSRSELVEETASGGTALMGIGVALCLLGLGFLAPRWKPVVESIGRSIPPSIARLLAGGLVVFIVVANVVLFYVIGRGFSSGS